MNDAVRQQSVSEVLRESARALAAAGLADAGAEARRLLEFALGWSAAALVARSHEALDDAQRADVQRVLARRLAHEPLSRIAGRREFYGRLFKVTPATLDPRPDSETLIDAVLASLAGRKAEPVRILDIGTGTGCLILTLLCELQNATGVATDISAPALEVARANAGELMLQSRVEFRETDLVANVDGPFDIVISNPPYIARDEIGALEPGVRSFDPVLALDGGRDGLDFYRRLARDLGELVPRGQVFLEVGQGQAGAVAQLLADEVATFEPEPQVFEDVAGIRRVVAARTRSRGEAEKGLGISKLAR